MLIEADLNAPAYLRYEKVGAPVDDGQRDRSGEREFSSLREAIHWAMNAEAPAGMEAFIRTASGAVLGPVQLEEIWLSVQGP
jgi:hypothetical protein